MVWVAGFRVYGGGELLTFHCQGSLRLSTKVLPETRVIMTAVSVVDHPANESQETLKMHLYLGGRFSSQGPWRSNFS